MQVNDEDCFLFINWLLNEILIVIFVKFNSLFDVFYVMLICRRWVCNVVDILWYCLLCMIWDKYVQICNIFSLEVLVFFYREFIKCFNFVCLYDIVSDGSVVFFVLCICVECFIFINCGKIIDIGFILLIINNDYLLVFDVFNDS